MKTAIVILTALVSFSAFAGEFTKPSSVYFAAASTWVPAEKVCRDGDVLRHKTKATIAVEYCDDNNQNCKTVLKSLVQPVVGTAYMCDNSADCDALVPYTLNQAAVNLYSYDSNKDESPTLVGKYVIPACKTGGGAAN